MIYAHIANYITVFQKYLFLLNSFFSYEAVDSVVSKYNLYILSDKSNLSSILLFLTVWRRVCPVCNLVVTERSGQRFTLEYGDPLLWLFSFWAPHISNRSGCPPTGVSFFRWKESGFSLRYPTWMAMASSHRNLSQAIFFP